MRRGDAADRVTLVIVADAAHRRGARRAHNERRSLGVERAHGAAERGVELILVPGSRCAAGFKREHRAALRIVRHGAARAGLIAVAAARALLLRACNTPGKTEKSEIPVSLEHAGVLALYPFRKISENRRLTTSLTTTAETEN